MSNHTATGNSSFFCGKQKNNIEIAAAITALIGISYYGVYAHFCWSFTATKYDYDKNENTAFCTSATAKELFTASFAMLGLAALYITLQKCGCIENPAVENQGESNQPLQAYGEREPLLGLNEEEQEEHTITVEAPHSGKGEGQERICAPAARRM